MSGSLQGAGGVGGLLAVVQNGETYRPAFDGNGNVVEYLSTDGTLAAHYEYSPFGETIIQTGSLADTFGFRFSTKYWEDEAKLYYYGYRFYVPENGRWLNRDLIEELGGFNLCALNRNNLIDRYDLLGLECDVTVLFGHGSLYDVPGNWLLNQAYDRLKTWDEKDRVALLGCVSTQVRALLFKRLLDQAGPSQDIIDALMKWFEISLNAGVDYTIGDENSWFPAFQKVIEAADQAVKDLCKKCCKDVYVKFVCQEDDPVISELIPIVHQMNREVANEWKDKLNSIDTPTHSPILASLPEGETFCGKTIRFSCENNYWEIWRWSHRN